MYNLEDFDVQGIYDFGQVAMDIDDMATDMEAMKDAVYKAVKDYRTICEAANSATELSQLHGASLEALRDLQTKGLAYKGSELRHRLNNSKGHRLWTGLSNCINQNIFELENDFTNAGLVD